MEHLSADQRALLQAELEQRRMHLDGRLAAQHGGDGPAEQTREARQQDNDGSPQRAGERAGEREVSEALSELETRELGAVGLALNRLRAGHYGICADCGTDIPFDRLKAEPWALRCVPCETKHETAAARRTA